MQIVTWLAANGSTYQSSRPRAPEDIAIPDRPTGMPAGAYNRETRSGFEKLDRELRWT